MRLGITHNVTIYKTEFSAVFDLAFTETFSIAKIQSAFRNCGIFPFDPTSINENRLMPSDDIEFTIERNPGIPAQQRSEHVEVEAPTTHAGANILATVPVEQIHPNGNEQPGSSNAPLNLTPSPSTLKSKQQPVFNTFDYYS